MFKIGNTDWVEVEALNNMFKAEKGVDSAIKFSKAKG